MSCHRRIVRFYSIFKVILRYSIHVLLKIYFVISARCKYLKKSIDDLRNFINCKQNKKTVSFYTYSAKVYFIDFCSIKV